MPAAPAVGARLPDSTPGAKKCSYRVTVGYRLCICNRGNSLMSSLRRLPELPPVWTRAV